MATTPSNNPSDYSGDVVEEMYKSITVPKMIYWWHFRDVLRGSDAAQPFWQYQLGSVLKDDDQKEMVAISLMHYGVYTGLGEAIEFSRQIDVDLATATPWPSLLVSVRRSWKAAYSALYSAVNGLVNIVHTLVSHNPPWGVKPWRIWNATPAQVVNLLKSEGHLSLSNYLEACRSLLELRDHLDHYWTVWINVAPGSFLLDSNFTKGYVVLRPNTDTNFSIDALARLQSDIDALMANFNLIYRELSVTGGLLDAHLAFRGWRIDHSGIARLGGRRPLP